MCKKNSIVLCVDDECLTCPTRRIPQEYINNNWVIEMNKEDPRTIPKGSHGKYNFKCKNCHHIDNRVVEKFVTNKGCSYCARNGTKLCKSDVCDVCYNKSLASVVLDRYWVEELNPGLDPRMIRKGNQKTEYSFYCKDDNCRHIHQNTPYGFNDSRTCKYCSPNQTYLCEDKECQGCFNRSMLSYCGYDNWVSNFRLNKDVDPRMIRSGSEREFAFKCRTCSHKHANTPKRYSISLTCKYCSNGNGKVCTNIKCNICYSNRFSSHPMCKYWKQESNDLDPNMLRINSHKIAIFQCSDCNQEYSATIKDVTRGFWCSCTNNKTETLILKWLRDKYRNLTIIPQFKIGSISNRRFDFLIKEYNIIIEVDGPQHFIQISNWEDPEKSRVVDIEKMIHALRDGYTIIRILQRDIWYDLIDWKSILIDVIHSYELPIIIYLSTTDIYDNHKRDMKTIK